MSRRRQRPPTLDHVAHVAFIFPRVGRQLCVRRFRFLLKCVLQNFEHREVARPARSRATRRTASSGPTSSSGETSTATPTTMTTTNLPSVLAIEILEAPHLNTDKGRRPEGCIRIYTDRYSSGPTSAFFQSGHLARIPAAAALCTRQPGKRHKQ